MRQAFRTGMTTSVAESKHSTDWFFGDWKLTKAVRSSSTLVNDSLLTTWNRIIEVLPLLPEPGYSGPTAISARPQRKFSTINAVLYAPLSRGRTHIKSSDPFQPPAVNPNYYAHPLDVITHVKSLQVGRRVLRTAPLDSIYEGEFEPGTGRVTDSDVETWSRGVTASDNHVVGSLAMMPQNLGGVVDTKLRVYGIKNLRVVGQ